MFVYKLSGCRFKSICWQFVPNLRFFSKGLRYSNSQQSFRNTFRPILYAMSSLAELTRYCQWDTKRLKLHFLYTSFCFLLCRTSFTAKNHQNTKIIKIQNKNKLLLWIWIKHVNIGDSRWLKIGSWISGKPTEMKSVFRVSMETFTCIFELENTI